MECNEAIYNPLCHACLAGEIRQWLDAHGSGEIKKKLGAGIKSSLRAIENSLEKFSDVKCVACKGEVFLCPYCFTEKVYKKLKAIARSRKAQKEFLSLFNFDFEHTGYSKDAEELGVI